MIKGIDCIIRLGLPGSGKTLDQTIEDVLPHLLAGETVYSCYWLNLNLPNLHYFQEFEEVEHLRNCVVVFDEIGQILPARQWELEGLRVQLFFQLHRHRHVDIIANTQDVSLVAKTVGIVANKWYLCESKNNKIIDWLLKKIFNIGFVMLSRSNVSYQGLKKMANGWELDGVIENSFKQEKKFYNHDKLLYRNLDHLKIELVHKYCPLCAMRQGTTILKDDTDIVCNRDKRGNYSLKEQELCPKHPNQPLEVRLSGIYDTDHEPELKEKIITLQPMIDCPAGHIKIKYGGRMSERQTDYLNTKTKQYNKIIQNKKVDNA